MIDQLSAQIRSFVLVASFGSSVIPLCVVHMWNILVVYGKSGSQIIRSSAVSHRRVMFYTFTPDVVKSVFFSFKFLFLAVLRFSGFSVAPGP